MRRATRPICKYGLPLIFLSTLSLRRATRTGYHGRADRPHFYPRSPCGERLIVYSITDKCELFLSTLSLRRATVGIKYRHTAIPISIHALLAESDCNAAGHSTDRGLFLSTLSLRRATVCHDGVRGVVKFLSTLSLRRATRYGVRVAKIDLAFLSTLSLRRATIWLDRWSTKEDQFLSTLSLRRATSLARYHAVGVLFLSTLSLRRATNVRITHNPGPCYFYPRSPCGERQHCPAPPTSAPDFYPRSPCGERPRAWPV